LRLEYPGSPDKLTSWIGILILPILLEHAYTVFTLGYLILRGRAERDFDGVLAEVEELLKGGARGVWGVFGDVEGENGDVEVFEDFVERVFPVVKVLGVGVDRMHQANGIA
jgi:hypothetical protein